MPEPLRSDRLQNGDLLDYPGIEAEMGRLGSPTTSRTLRFWVSEGVLPPPCRRGKTPVYPRRWILDLLLAVHCMKERLERSLAEVASVVERLEEPPSVLVDQCTRLSALFTGGESTGPAVARRVVDRFFGEIVEGGRQPGELSIAELLERERRSRSAAGGEPLRFREPIEGEPPPSGEPIEGEPPPSREPIARGPSPPAVAGGEEARTAAAEGAGVDVREARRREDEFIRGFERAFAASRSVPLPDGSRRVPVRSAARRPRIADEYQRVAAVLRDAHRFDRDLFDRLPLNKSTLYRLGGRRGAGAARRGVVVAGACWSPIRELVERGRSARPAGASELRRILDRLIDEGAGFHSIGVLSTTGWERELTRFPPRGEFYRVALAERVASGGWRVWHDFSAGAEGLALLWDPEPIEEKLARIAARVEALEELAVRGGAVVIDDLPGRIGEPEDLVARSVERLIERDRGFLLRTARGYRLLERARSSGSTRGGRR